MMLIPSGAPKSWPICGETFWAAKKMRFSRKFEHPKSTPYYFSLRLIVGYSYIYIHVYIYMNIYIYMNVHIHFSSSVCLRNSMTPKILPTAGATVVAVWSLRRSWSNPSWRLVSETSCPGFCPNFATGSLLEHETHQVCRLTHATAGSREYKPGSLILKF